VRHLGQERQVTSEQAVLDKKILRILYRQGKLGEGELAGKCYARLSSSQWRGSVSRLIGYGFISAEEVGHGTARRLGLTDAGMQWGEELACTINAEALKAATETE
jgi:hypothetical protein